MCTRAASPVSGGVWFRVVLLACAVAGSAGGLAAQDTASAAVRLSLGDAVTAAASRTPAVAIAGLRAEEARGRLTQARSVFYPDLNAAGSVVRRSMNPKTFGFSFPGFSLPPRIGPFNIWDLRPQAAQTLFDPAGWTRASAARAQLSAATAEAGTTGQTAAAQAGGAYIGLLRARATLGAREEDVSLARELIQDAQAQFKAGVGTRLDVVRASTQEAQARAAVEIARAAVTQADIALARALGLTPGTAFVPVDSLAPELGRSAAPEDLAAATPMALAQRTELASASASVTAARLASQATRMQRLGRLQLAGDYGLSGIKPADMITTAQLALQYAIPVFEGFAQEGQAHEQEAVRREAEVRLGDLRQQVMGEVATAIAALASGRAVQTTAAEQLALATEELREARLRYTNGLSGNIDVITAQADLVRARTALIDALAQTAQARVQLARAVGVTATVR